MNTKDLALLIAKYVRQNRAKDVVILDISKISSIADYFVICTGLTNRHSQAMIHDLLETLRKQNFRPQGNEGYELGRWAILDFDDVVLHVFLEEARSFYDLEDVWADAKKIPLPVEEDQETPNSPRVNAILTDLFPPPTPTEESFFRSVSDSENAVKECEPLENRNDVEPGKAMDQIENRNDVEPGKATDQIENRNDVEPGKATDQNPN